MNSLREFISEFRRVSSIVIDQLWNVERLPKFIDHKTLNIDSWLSARAIQALSKQIIGIVKGTKKSAKKNGKIPSKPDVSSINPLLDQRFIKFDLEKKNSFDGWITISSLGNKKKIKIPVRKNAHFNKLFDKQESVLKRSIELTDDRITVFFEIPGHHREVQRKDVVGIDIGISDLWSCSDRRTSQKNNHGQDLSEILRRLSRKKKGSKGFKRTQDHRTNFINWSVKSIFNDNISTVIVEDIKNLRKGKSCDRLRSHWTYVKIISKIEQTAQEFGVQVLRVNPRNTSRKCSSCGVIDVESRKNKSFRCISCGYADDADINAAINIASSFTARQGDYNPLREKT